MTFFSENILTFVRTDISANITLVEMTEVQIFKALKFFL